MKFFIQPIKYVLSAYSNSMKKRPVATQVLTTGILVTTGDFIAQKFVEKKSNLDYRRSGQFFMLGTVFVGPFLNVWYRALSLLKGSPKVAAMKMVVVDQMFAPSLIISFFLVSIGLLNGQSKSDIYEKWNDQFPKMLINNYKIWPAVQIINFYFVPLNYRIVFVNSFAVIWNTYVSYATNKKLESLEENGVN